MQSNPAQQRWDPRTAFQLLWANLLNHWHLITKLFPVQLTALVLEMKWLRFGDLPILHIFMLFIWLLPSTSFTEFIRQARFLWKPLLCTSCWELFGKCVPHSTAASPLSFVSGVQRRFSRVSPSTENIFIKIVKNYLIYPAVAENSPCSPWIFSNVEALTASTVEPAWKFHAGDLNCHEKRKREMCPVESPLWDISSNPCFTFINMCFLLYII